MFAFIIRRLSFLPLVFFGVTIAIVLLLQLLTPIQRAATFVTSEAQLRNIDVIIEQYRLEDPWYIQYGLWLRNAFEGNLGYSRTAKAPVLTAIRTRFPPTVELAVLALFPIIGVGIWMGTAAALNRDKLIDQVTRVFSIIGWSLPTFVLGIWLLVVFYGGLDWFQPGQVTNAHSIELALAGASGEFVHYTGFLTIDSIANGRWDILLDVLWHLVLPVITLAAVSSAQIMRVMRSSLLDALGQDYVRTARAKGLAESVVNQKHARRNALIPVLTLSGFTLIGLLNGVVITETIFNYPGLGQWLANAAVQLDYASVMGGAVFVAIIVVLANLVVDVLYGIVDPRIRYD
jgi:peptide/nickel transport system permease protein